MGGTRTHVLFLYFKFVCLSPSLSHTHTLISFHLSICLYSLTYFFVNKHILCMTFRLHPAFFTLYYFTFLPPTPTQSSGALKIGINCNISHESLKRNNINKHRISFGKIHIFMYIYICMNPYGIENQCFDTLSVVLFCIFFPQFLPLLSAASLHLGEHRWLRLKYSEGYPV